MAKMDPKPLRRFKPSELRRIKAAHFQPKIDRHLERVAASRARRAPPPAEPT
jgi:hypothetical protein